MGGGAASGKIGAMVASHNTGGQYVRARTTPTNPNTVFQQAIRNAVKSLATSWNAIFPSQRDAWAVYAANTTLRNRLGDSIKTSGIAQYIRSNASRLQAGLDRLDDAPTIFDLGDVQSAPIIFETGTTTGTLTLDQSADWVEAGTTSQSNMLVYISRPQNLGKTFFKGPFQLAGVINATSANASATQVIALPFAYDISGDQQLFGQVRVTRGDARLTSTFQFQG